MKNDEIYDHLAQVYLGKRERSDEKLRKQFNAWLVINIAITVFILASAFYGFTAFIARRGGELQSRVMFSLSNTPLRIAYNLNDPYPQVKTFSMPVPSDINLDKYRTLNFSIRGMEGGFPDIVRIELRNARNESSSFYVNDVRYDWQQRHIPLEQFSEITDWSSITDVSFIFEAWNTEKKKGAVLIEDLSFSK